MDYYPKIVEKLINTLTELPNIGPKSAERIVNFFIEQSEQKILNLAENLVTLKKEVKLCKACFNLSDNSLCGICSDEGRERVICVVEEVKDLVLIEKSGYKGLYHVLGGRISPLEEEKKSAGNLKIPQLLERVEKEKDIAEVIIATNPTSEGEMTALYLSELFKKNGIKHSRLACGLPVGGEIEYVDSQTLKKSIEGRKQL